MSDDDTQVWEKHESLYFMDGTVVILTLRQDKPSMLFRVHKSVLSSHSPVFSDMFDVCDSSDLTDEDSSENLYDGVPLVCLLDDSDHLAVVLKVLYYQSDPPWMSRSPHYPAFITPILDLARKYGIDRMHAQIVEHLECDWPTTLKDWDKLEREIQSVVDDPGGEPIDDLFPEPAAAIKLAHQFNIPSILPAAFYHLSRLTISDDWEKTHAHSSTRTHSQNLTKRTARWELLSAEDFRCLLLGKAKIVELLRGYTGVEDLYHLPTDYEFDPEECSGGGDSWRRTLDECLQSADPLKVLQTNWDAPQRCEACKKKLKDKAWVFRAKIWGEPDNSQRCEACTKKLKDKAQVVRAKIWEGLDDLFHLNGLTTE